MKFELHRFAPIGLIISGLAALTSFGLYIVQREWNLPLQISIGLVVLGLAIYVLFDPDQVRKMVTGRQARYGSNAVVLVLAVLGILVVVNYLVFQNATSWELRWDLTEDQQHTLTPETVEMLSEVPEPVQAQAFFSGQQATQADRARDLLDTYKFYSEGNFDYEFIDPNENPVKAQEAEITRDGEIVLWMGDRKEQVSFASEQNISTALVKLINPDERKIYFLTGHGELSPDEGGDNSFVQVNTLLGRKNYTIELLNLLSTNQIPEDATAIVIAGPLQPVSEDEVTLLSDYLEGGGSLVVMEEPVVLTDSQDNRDPLTEYLSDSWGIQLENNVIVDLSSNQPFVAVANRYGDHVITQKMQNLVTIFPDARSIQIGDESIEGVSQQILVFTSEQSWGETDYESLQEQQLAPDEGEDRFGPLPLVVAAENFQTDARIIVVGDVSFASNAYFDAYGNSDFFINMIDWAAEQDNLINLTPRQRTQRLMIPPQRYVMGLILLGSVFLLPGIALAAGIVVWIQRRKRG